MNREIFKAYDIRGVYPAEINEETVDKIARAYAVWLKPKKVSLGRDVRCSSKSLFEAAKNALIESGVDVFDIGVITTDMHYFAVANYGLDGGMIITASHNPAEYNGIKMVRKEAIEISLDTGAADIRDLAIKNKFFNSNKRGKIEKLNVLDDYIEKVISVIDKKLITNQKIVVNPNYGAAGKVLEKLAQVLNLDLVKLNFDEDGTFPKGRPDPLIIENRKEVIETVKRTGADLGVAWDADADRCFFFDEMGSFVDASYEMALLAQIVLAKYPGGKVVHDPRSVRVTNELTREAGGTPLMEQAGRSFIKNRMRKEGAVFGGETSGHFFYKDYYYCDNGMITFLLMLQKICESGDKLSEIVNPLREQYPVSGEINFKVSDTDEKIKEIKEKYSDGQFDGIDGVSVTYPAWRFNVRASNTEPLLRLNIEAKTKNLVKEKAKELTELIEN